MRQLCLIAGPALAAGSAHAVDDGRGRDWRPLSETVSNASRPTWDQIRAVCPDDGTTPCTGSLGGIVMKDWSGRCGRS